MSRKETFTANAREFVLKALTQADGRNPSRNVVEATARKVVKALRASSAEHATAPARRKETSG